MLQATIASNARAAATLVERERDLRTPGTHATQSARPSTSGSAIELTRRRKWFDGDGEKRFRDALATGLRNGIKPMTPKAKPAVPHMSSGLVKSASMTTLTPSDLLDRINRAKRERVAQQLTPAGPKSVAK